jgi:O-methyltransferase
MKKLLNAVLRQAGYQIVRTNNPNPLSPRFRQVVRELYGCYRDMKFANLEDLDDATLDLMTRLDGTQISEAIYILHSLRETRDLPGDVCEFGVAQGYTSTLLSSTIRATQKHIWLYDSFQGLPKPTKKDKLKDDIFGLKSMEAYEGTMKHSIEVVKNNLRQIRFPEDRTHIIDGFIEQTLVGANRPKKVSFAYVDFDFYDPIKTALIFLDTVIAEGGVVIVDDYDFFSEGAKIAVDEFHALNRERYLLELPIRSAGHFALLKRKRI